MLVDLFLNVCPILKLLSNKTKVDQVELVVVKSEVAGLNVSVNEKRPFVHLLDRSEHFHGHSDYLSVSLRASWYGRDVI